MKRRGFNWSVAAIATAVVALAVVPLWVNREIEAVDEERALVTDTLNALRDEAASLTATYAQQMVHFQRYLLTGSAESRIRYQALLDRERNQWEQLQAHLDALEEYLPERVLQFRRGALPLLELASEWQVAHLDVVEDREERAAYLGRLDRDQELFSRVISRAEDFREELKAEVEAGQARVDQLRDDQLTVTAGLIVLALIATAAVWRLDWRRSQAVQEATARRKDAVRARREIDAVLEATAEAVLSLDLEGQVTRLNASGARLLRMTEEDARGRTVREVLFPDARWPDSALPEPPVRDPGSGDGDLASESGDDPVAKDPRTEMLGSIARALLEGSSVDGEDGVIHPRRSGAVEVRWSLRPLRDGTEHRGAVMTLTDMREVRAAERALRKAVKAREETMAVVGHDLRSPLSSISAAAELLMEVPLPEDRRRAQLESIGEAADRMNGLIGDLLDMARIDAGGFRVNARETRLGPVLRSALRLEEPGARNREVELEACWGEDLPPVLADERRILQVLGNLLSNALRYTPSGGRVALGAAPADGMVEVWVRDSGSGIDPADLPHLWDPFWQPEGDRRARSEGAGLGLAIVRGIVEAHGGRVRAASTPGSGSRFSFTLPVARRAATAPPPATPPAAPPRRS